MRSRLGQEPRRGLSAEGGKVSDARSSRLFCLRPVERDPHCRGMPGDRDRSAAKFPGNLAAVQPFGVQAPQFVQLARGDRLRARRGNVPRSCRSRFKIRRAAAEIASVVLVTVRVRAVAERREDRVHCREADTARVEPSPSATPLVTALFSRNRRLTCRVVAFARTLCYVKFGPLYGPV